MGPFAPASPTSPPEPLIAIPPEDDVEPPATFPGMPSILLELCGRITLAKKEAKTIPTMTTRVAMVMT
jgi:hypothetical protein